jgi:hypothetical protein
MKTAITAIAICFVTTFFAQDYKFGKVSKEELEEKTYPLDSTADAAYLYKYRRTYFDFLENKGGVSANYRSSRKNKGLHQK